MFVSLTTPHPYLGTPGVLSARGFGEDSITISSFGGATTVYITVHSYNVACNFTVLVSLDGVINLMDGVPQGSSITKEAVQYFQYQVATDAVDLTVVSTPLAGMIQTYVSTTQLPDPRNPSTYTW